MKYITFNRKIGRYVGAWADGTAFLVNADVVAEVTREMGDDADLVSSWQAGMDGVESVPTVGPVTIQHRGDKVDVSVTLVCAHTLVVTYYEGAGALDHPDQTMALEALEGCPQCRKAAGLTEEELLALTGPLLYDQKKFVKNGGGAPDADSRRGFGPTTQYYLIPTANGGTVLNSSNGADVVWADFGGLHYTYDGRLDRYYGAPAKS